MRILSIIALIATITLAQALPPHPADTQKHEIVYHNATIHIGNGKVLKNATIAFAEGKITRIGHFKMKWQDTDIDLQGKHIYPGFILPITSLGLTEISSVKATKDVQETGQLNPNVRSIVAYNTDSELTPTLRFNGILLAQPTPQGGLVSGLSSIVQLDAWNWQDAAVSIDDAVHVNWPSSVQMKFDFATFSMKMEKNKNYTTQLATVKSLFLAAKSAVNQQNNQVNLKLDAVIPVFSGTRKVYIHTNTSKSIIAAINFFQQIGVNNLVLVAGQEVEPVIGFIQQAKVPVIVKATHGLPKREDSSVNAGYTVALKLQQAGILTALAYPGVMSARNLPFTAGTLVSYGMDKQQALQLITSNTAKILGIDANYGTLEAGKSATLIITTGDALDMRTSILYDAYIDGRKLNLDGRQQELNKRFSNKYGL
ncbi:FIG00552507: hypothetical protein [hydrothermal vent metagenome]|uniref:Amidohydrolase-related domain-containing protein n=1 Tax=hydrothermal vent metagenome TaxID=652676 RepID=A0A3B0VEE3_9ZZZZ